MMKRGTPWTIAPVIALMLLAVRPAVAQDPQAMLKEAINLYERGHDDEALEKLKSVIAADPSSEVAWSLRNSVDFRTWARIMIKGNQHHAVVKYLFDLALPAEKAKAKDDVAINALIGQMDSGTFPERQKAAFQLAADHGEYAVPHLVPRLKSTSNEVRAATMEWLRRLGVQAVMPLIQSLEMGDPMITASGLTVLGQIRDRRALPYVAAFAAGPGNVPEVVREAARKALADLGTPAAGDLAGQFLALAEAYYQRNPAVVDPFRATYIVWACVDGALVANEVPRDLYHLKLAEDVCFDVLAWDAANVDARVLLASALIAEHEAVRGAPAEEAPAKSIAHASEMVLSMGADTLDATLRKALADGRPEVAAGAVRALDAVLDNDSFTAPSGLTQALAAPFKEVRFLAALAVAHIYPRAPFAGSEQVVPALMEALSQDAIRSAVVIDDNADTRNRVVSDLNARGWFAYGSSSGALGLAAIRDYPVEDLVIIRYNLKDATVAEVVKTLKTDPRTADRPIAILADGPQMAAAKEGYGDKVQSYIEAPPVADAYEPGLKELAKVADPAREAATLIAARAARALGHLDPRGGLFATATAVPALAATLKGDDRVRGPALAALGRIGDPSAVPAIMAVFSDGSASEEIRGTAAIALARISRSAGAASPELLQALSAGINGAGSQTYLDMLGQACGIVPVEPALRAQLLQALRARIKVDLVE